MKSQNKEQLISSLENKVEQHIEAAVRDFQNMPEQALLEPAANGGWSIAQCLHHLNSYGHYYLPRIREELEKPSSAIASDTFKSGWLGKYFTKSMDPETGKKKFKAFKGHIPPLQLDAHAVVAEFILQQEELLHSLQLARKKDLNTIKIPISISKYIRLKLGDTFQFLIAPNERHIQQARRNLPVQYSKV